MKRRSTVEAIESDKSFARHGNSIKYLQGFEIREYLLKIQNIMSEIILSLALTLLSTGFELCKHFSYHIGFDEVSDPMNAGYKSE